MLEVPESYYKTFFVEGFFYHWVEVLDFIDQNNVVSTGHINLRVTINLN